MPEQDYLERAVGSEAVFGPLQEEVLERLLLHDQPSTLVSSTKRTDKGLEVTTTVDGSKEAPSLMIVDGKYAMHTRWFDNQLTGDFKISHVNGKDVREETSHLQLLFKHLDYMNPANAHISWTRNDANGNLVSKHEAASSEVQRGKFDENGQPLRIASAIGDKVNARPRFSFPGDTAMDTEYLITDPDLGTLSYNETRDKSPSGFNRRSVVRDQTGIPVAIVSQSYKLDASGDPTDIRTSARRPQKLR